jgi:GDPmannose 4,6-dehydratase
LFNHESPRRGETFVTRKITRYIGQLVSGQIAKDTKLKLGNINAVRDWGHAKDYVEAMHRMLLADRPDDFVISTGQSHSVKDFLDIAFKLVGLNYEDHIEIDPDLYRPSEVEFLQGNSQKAQDILNWIPSTTFEELVQDMVRSDTHNL